MREGENQRSYLIYLMEYPDLPAGENDEAGWASMIGSIHGAAWF